MKIGKTNPLFFSVYTSNTFYAGIKLLICFRAKRKWLSRALATALHYNLYTNYIATLHNENHIYRIFVKIFLGRRKNQQSKPQRFLFGGNLNSQSSGPCDIFDGHAWKIQS